MDDTIEFVRHFTKKETWAGVMPVSDVKPSAKQELEAQIVKNKYEVPGSTLPAFIRGSEFPQRYDLEKRPPLVDGLFRMRDNVLLGAPPKMGKSWFFASLGVALAQGERFLGMETRKSKVLLIDLELHRDDCLDRIYRVTETQGLTSVPQDLWVWCLRDYEYDLDILITEMEQRIDQMGGCDAIILDPIYMLGYEEFDENNAQSVRHFLKHLALLKSKFNSALLLSHHFSKGNKGRESHSDRISGSGAFQRWPDSLITLTPHRVEKHAVLEVTGRSMPKFPPQVLHVAPPVIRATDLAVEF